jgi:xylulose-5-phosphate/fructose-6-phosphate phosphoketolase
MAACARPRISHRRSGLRAQVPGWLFRMFNQHAKWLKITAQLPWRGKIASLNYLLASRVWQHDHNGFTHQDPGFLDHVVNKKAHVFRV